MSGYKTGKTSSLFDPTTGELVGQIDLRGNEQLGLSTAQVASLVAAPLGQAGSTVAVLNASKTALRDPSGGADIALGGGGGVPGGSNGQVQYNNNGAHGGMAGWTFDNAINALTKAAASPFKLLGATSGFSQLEAPAVAGTAVVTLPAVTGTLAILGANTFTGIQSLPVGSASAPSLTFGFSTTGFYSISASSISITSAGIEVLRCSQASIAAYGGANLAVQSNAGNLTLGLLSDVILGWYAAAIFRIGAADAASPVAQTIRAQGSRVGIDTNVGGAHLSIGSGTGTGTGTPSEFRLQSPVVVASGNGAQTQTTGLKITQGVAVRTVYAVANLPTPSATLEGGMAWVTDATTSLALGIGTVVVGGGTNKTQVSCNGTNWLIG